MKSAHRVNLFKVETENLIHELNAALELVHTDLAGPIDPEGKDGFKYALAFTDDYSGAVFVYF